jgi:hypothetical protein
MNRLRALLPLLLLVGGLPACAFAQTADTTRIPVPFDSTWRVIDSVIVRADTFGHDTTAHLTRDSLVIVVRPPADSTPLPPPSGARPHEPAGFRTITVLTFSGPGEGGWGRSSGYRTDPTDPVSPGTVLEYTRQPQATAVSFAPGLFDAPAFPPVRDLYVAGTFQLAADYPANPSNTNKLGLFVGLAGGAQVFFNGFGGQVTKGGFAGPLYAQVNLQGVPRGLGGNSASGDAHFGGQAAEIVRGRWYTVYLRLTVNSYGVANGVLDAWLFDWTTGREVQFNHRTTLALIGPGTIPTTTAASGFDLLRMNAIHGGGAVVTPTVARIRWGHLIVSGR